MPTRVGRVEVHTHEAGGLGVCVEVFDSRESWKGGASKLLERDYVAKAPTPNERLKLAQLWNQRLAERERTDGLQLVPKTETAP